MAVPGIDLSSATLVLTLVGVAALLAAAALTLQRAGVLPDGGRLEAEARVRSTLQQ